MRNLNKTFLFNNNIMGNSVSFFEEENSCEIANKEKEQIFGGYKNKTNPRPGYYKTRCNVFYRADKLEKVHVPSFKKLKFGWAKDKNSVFFKGDIIKGVNLETFKMDPAGKSFGYDTSKNGKYRKWFEGKILKE
jgi:hypothetical protein